MKTKIEIFLPFVMTNRYSSTPEFLEPCFSEQACDKTLDALALSLSGDGAFDDDGEHRSFNDGAILLDYHVLEIPFAELADQPPAAQENSDELPAPV